MKQQDILKLWRDVEIFDLPNFDYKNPLLEENEELPWINPQEIPKKNYKWRYTLFFGKIAKKAPFDYIEKLLGGSAPNDWETSVRGFTCLSTLILNESGKPDRNGYVTATYLFGIEALENNADMSSVSEALENAKADYIKRYFKEEENDSEGRTVTWSQLRKEIDYLKNKIDQWWKGPIEVYLHKEQAPKDSEPNTSFENVARENGVKYL